MNVGVFSGSFNPIHVGHLILANYMTEFAGLDEVWFLVTPQNPLKNSEGLLNQDERLRMVGLAVEDYPKMKASNFEFSLAYPTYTVNTLHELSKSYPQHTFFLIIGADNWEIFPQWKDYESIIDNFDVLVYPRLNHTITIPKDYKKKVRAVDAPVVEISSTFIRNAIADGKNIQSFLSFKVYKYIINNYLYTK